LVTLGSLQARTGQQFQTPRGIGAVEQGFAVPGRRRDQLGWLSMVPGRLACSSMPSASSSGSNTSGARV
jgi:hypothetical protein